MKRLTLLLMAVFASLAIVACQDMTNEDVGTLAGGLAGAAVGSQFGGGSGQTVAIVAGTLAGAYMGNRIGQTMDNQDRMAMSQALNQTPDGKSITWLNNNTGNQYTVEPTKTFRQNNNYCREFVQDAKIGGQTQQVYGRACQQPDGSWQVVSMNN